MSESKRTLIEEAAKLGYTVTERQIDRIRHAGLLPEARLISLGRGAGMSALHAPEDTAQLIAVLQQLRKRRSFSEAAFQLWIAGYRIDNKTVRKSLFRAANVVDKAKSMAAKQPDLARDIGEKFGDAFSRSPRSKTLLARRMDRDNLSKVIELVFGNLLDPQTYAPQSPDDAREQAREIEHVMGLDQARTDVINGAGPWLTGDSSREIFSSLEIVQRAKEILTETSDADLLEGRELYSLMAELVSMMKMIQRLHGENALGTGEITNSSISRTGRPYDGPWGFVVILLLWRLNPDVRTKLEAILQPYRAWCAGQGKAAPDTAATLGERAS